MIRPSPACCYFFRMLFSVFCKRSDVLMPPACTGPNVTTLGVGGVVTVGVWSGGAMRLTGVTGGVALTSGVLVAPEQDVTGSPRLVERMTFVASS